MYIDISAIKSLEDIQALFLRTSRAYMLRLRLQVLKSQSQVYLPINNDLSQHGHVAAFLEQVYFWIDFVSVQTRATDRCLVSLARACSTSPRACRYPDS